MTENNVPEFPVNSIVPLLSVVYPIAIRVPSVVAEETIARSPLISNVDNGVVVPIPMLVAVPAIIESVNCSLVPSHWRILLFVKLSPFLRAIKSSATLIPIPVPIEIVLLSVNSPPPLSPEPLLTDLERLVAVPVNAPTNVLAVTIPVPDTLISPSTCNLDSIVDVPIPVLPEI